MARRYTLVTGATGLVGRYLIRDLLLEGVDLALMIRPTAKMSVADRAEQILQYWERELGRPLVRPIVLSGDVSDQGLGLSSSDRSWVARNCGAILHNAASLTFHGEDRSADPWRTNLDGTARILELCESASISCLHFVSTAYVCGDRAGTIYESELDCGQKFRNDYEHSKLLAEKLVRSCQALDSLTIYRPAVIAGDSQTGYTSTYHGLYMYLQLMAVLVQNTEPDEHGVRHTNIRLNMTGDEPRNIVPVDWVSAVISYLVTHRETHGETYHLSPIERVTPRQIIEAGYRYFNSRGVEYCGAEHNSSEWVSRAERATYDNKTMYESYEHSDPIFDNSNLLRNAPHLPCPAIDEAMLQKFLKYGEEDRWGRRKEPIPEVPDWAARHVESVANELIAAFLADHSHYSASNLTLGLNLTGPGGGQWTLVKNGPAVQVELGLPAGEWPVIQSTVADFLRIAKLPEVAPKSLRLLPFELMASP